MKYFRTILSAVFLCIITNMYAQTNVLRIPEITYPAGKTLSLPVELENASDVVGVQFDLSVPYELSVDTANQVITNLTKNRITNHKVICQKKGTQWRDANEHGGINTYYNYRFIIYSEDNSKLSGSTGTLLTIEMPIPDNLANKTVIPLYLIDNSVVLSNRNKENVLSAQVNGNVTIEVVPRPDLLPSNITVSQTIIDPKGTIDFSWKVSNIGDLATEAGWTERLYLESQSTGTRVYIGSTSYNGKLAINASVERSAQFTLDDFPGISGLCRPVVQIIPAAGCGENALYQANNTVSGSKYSVRVNKYLILTANKNLILKNSTNGYYCELRRTGDLTESQTFNISSIDKAGHTDRLRFSDNGKVTFSKGANRASFYLYPVNNERFDIDQHVAVIVNESLNNGYDMAVDSVLIEETNLIALTLRTDKDDYNEGETIHLTASVSQRPFPGQLAVYLNIEEQKRFKLPQRIVFEDGALEASVDIPVIQDNSPSNDMSICITGTADHHKSAETLFILHDDDTPAIQMTLSPKTVSEGAGPQAIMGTITRAGVTNNKITIKLTDDGFDDIYYSAQTLTMPAGTTTVNFPLGIKDNQAADGDRLVHIRAAVYMTDCNCTAIGDKQAVVTDSIIITDNDGPTLSVIADKSTILEGNEEGCNLTITRNNIGNEDLTITIETDAEDVQYETTAIIPAGQRSVSIPFRALSNSAAEGDRTISVVAKAEGFSNGSTWLLISDRTMPDLTITAFELSNTVVNENTPITVTIQVKNIGSAAVPANIPIKLYYDDHEWTTYTMPTGLDSGEAKYFSFRPNNFLSTGKFAIKAVVNPTNKPVELLTTNNTSSTIELTGNSLYTYTMQAEKPGYNVNETAKFTGTCIGIDGQINPSHYMELFIDCNGQRQTFGNIGGINDNGRFMGQCSIPASFSGTVNIGACARSDAATTKVFLGSFEVYGMERTENSYIVNEIFKDEPYAGKIRLRNTCGLDMHNITATLEGRTANYGINITPIATLPAHGEVDLEYTITGNKVTSISDYEQIQFVLKSDEGAKLTVNTWNYTKMRTADLAVSENNIKTTVQTTQPRTYPIFLTNKGEAPTGKISISLPTGMGKFVTLASASEIPSLNTGDSTMILLRFNGQGFDVNIEQTGTLAINCENGNGTVVHFSVTTVSESKGNLKVYVEDEMTIYGDKDGNHPRVNEATVKLKDYNTGADIKTLTTDKNGYVTFEGINEGFYQLYVTAPKHDDYRQNVVVAPGETKNHTATISYQAVSVTWDVVETEVQDEYEIVSTLTYETQVPVPVIVMTAPDTLALDLMEEGKSTMYNIVLRNEGLIAAQNTKLTLPEISGYTFTPLVQYEGVIIGAQQSYVIPVRVTHDVVAGSRGLLSSRGGMPCSGRYLADFEWPCGSDHKHAWVAKTVNLVKNTATGGGGGCAGDGGWVGAGGGSGAPAFNGRGTGISWKAASDGALRGTIDLLCAMSNLVPGPPDGTDDALDRMNDVLDIWQNGGDWNSIKNAINNEGNRRIEGAKNDLLNGLTGGGYDTYNDWKNFYNGVKGVYEGVGRGDYLSKSLKGKTTKAESSSEEQDPSLVEGTTEWYVKIFEDYVDNSYFRTYLEKMNLYGTVKFARYDLMTELLNATEALDHYTPEFAESIDSLNSIISDMTYGITAFGYGGTIVGEGKSLEEMQDRIDAVKINGSDTYYDFNYNQYVERMVLYIKKYMSWRAHKAQIGQPGSVLESNPVTEDGWRDMDTPSWTYGKWYTLDEIVRSRYVKEYANRIDSCQNAMLLKGFDSWDDLYASAQKDLLDMYENMGKNTCASVKLEIDQKLVMTRQAFRGTLTMENGLNTDLTGIELSLLVKDLMGTEATSHEFQINFESIDGFEGSVNGPWTLGPKAKGVATILFIPTKYAAPDALTTWSFGGTLYFNDGEGATQVRSLLPVSLQVKPSPDLDLTYFMQRDVYGDNPLTKDVVEPMVPAEFAVLIHNKGKGDASNIRMFTRQPQIIDNEKGLFIDFNIISSRLNGGNSVLALDSTVATTFGDIAAGGSAYAQWDLTASLLGHFNKYDISVNHVTSYGNSDLSLLDQVTIHELIHSVRLPIGSLMGYWLPQTQDLHGWAVNDNLGINPTDEPDRMYLSDGTTLPILSFTDKTTVKYSGNYSYNVTIDVDETDMQDGFNFIYISFADPTMGGGGIKSVRADRPLLKNNQIWQTQYTMRDGADPIRDNKVHALIAFQKGRDNKPYSFQIEFEPAPLNRLEVKSIETVPQGDAIATDVLDELTVSFNKPVKPETFTRNDMVLRYEGEKQTSDILITKAADNDSVFTLKMNNVDRNGYYTLLVNTVDVTDTEDFTGLDGKQVGWMLFKGGLVQYNVEPWPSVQAGNVTTSNNGVTSGDVIYGADVTMTATPQDSYTFDYWGTVDEAIESIASSRGRLKGETSAPQIQESQIGRYSTENPVVVPMKKACNMRAVFKPKTYTVTFVYDGNQGEFNATSAVYNHGDRLSLRATPAEGYSFVGYSDGSAILSTAAEYEYTVTGPATITVLFKSDAPEEILLRESIDYTPAAVNNANVRLQRTFEKSLWNTVCVPFDIDEPANVFGEGTQVARLNGIDGNVVQFSTVTGMEANVPYLIMPGKLNNNQDISDSTSAISIYSISNTEIVPPGATMSECSGGVEMIGTYINSDIPAAGDYYVLSTNLLEYIGIGAEIPSGRFRAYFHIPGTTGETLKIAIDGIITGIGLQLQPVTRKGDIYTLSGVLLHKNADINTLRRQGRLQPGIYIMNGQKIVVK